MVSPSEGNHFNITWNVVPKDSHQPKDNLPRSPSRISPLNNCRKPSWEIHHVEMCLYISDVLKITTNSTFDNVWALLPSDELDWCFAQRRPKITGGYYGILSDIDNGTGTIGNNGSWTLFLSWTSVKLSTWFYTFSLVFVPVPAQVLISVNKSLGLSGDHEASNLLSC